MKRSVLSLITVAAVLSGCAMSPPDQDTEHVASDRAALEIYPTSVEPGDLATPPDGQLVFIVYTTPRWDEASGQVVFDGQEWLERQDLPVFAGGVTRVSVASERFPTCGLGGDVTMHLRYDDGRTQQVELGGRQGNDTIAFGDLKPPVGVHGAQVWFHAHNEDGCDEWDSDYGRNYRIPIYTWEPTVVHFNGDWTERASGPVRAGTAVVVDYDEARLPDCRGTYHGYPSWHIYAWMRGGSGAPMRQDMVSYDYAGPHGTPTGAYHMKWAVFPVPYDAQQVSLWFENEQYPPICHGWDSDYGANYVFDTQ